VARKLCPHCGYIKIELFEGELLQECFLGREVIEERSLADPQALDYVVHAGLFVSAFAEQSDRRVEDRSPLLGLLLFTQAHGLMNYTSSAAKGILAGRFQLTRCCEKCGDAGD